MEGLSSDIDMSADSEMDLENEEPPSAEAVLDMIDAFLETPSNNVDVNHLHSELKPIKRQHLLKNDEDCYNSSSSDSGSEKDEEYYDAKSLSVQDINLIIMGGPKNVENLSNITVANKIESDVAKSSKCKNEDKKLEEDSNFELKKSVLDNNVTNIPSSSDNLYENSISETINIDTNKLSDCDVQIQATYKGKNEDINDGAALSKKNDFKDTDTSVSSIKLTLQNSVGDDAVKNVLLSSEPVGIIDTKSADNKPKDERLFSEITHTQLYKAIITEESSSKSCLDIEKLDASEIVKVQHKEDSLDTIQSSFTLHNLEAEQIEMSNVNLENVEIQTVVVDNSSESCDTVESDSEGATETNLSDTNINLIVSEGEESNSTNFINEENIAPTVQGETESSVAAEIVIEEKSSPVEIPGDVSTVSEKLDYNSQHCSLKQEKNSLTCEEKSSSGITKEAEISPVVIEPSIKLNENIVCEAQKLPNIDISENINEETDNSKNVNTESNKISNIESSKVEIVIEQKNETDVKIEDNTIECSKNDTVKENESAKMNENDIKKENVETEKKTAETQLEISGISTVLENRPERESCQVQEIVEIMEVDDSNDFIIESVVEINNSSSTDDVDARIFPIVQLLQDDVKETDIEIQPQEGESSPKSAIACETEHPEKSVLTTTDDELKNVLIEDITPLQTVMEVDELIVESTRLEKGMEVDIQSKSQVGNMYSKCVDVVEDVDSYTKSTEEMEMDLIQVVEECQMDTQISAEMEVIHVVECQMESKNSDETKPIQVTGECKNDSQSSAEFEPIQVVEECQVEVRSSAEIKPVQIVEESKIDTQNVVELESTQVVEECQVEVRSSAQMKPVQVIEESKMGTQNAVELEPTQVVEKCQVEARSFAEIKPVQIVEESKKGTQNVVELESTKIVEECHVESKNSAEEELKQVAKVCKNDLELNAKFDLIQDVEECKVETKNSAVLKPENVEEYKPVSQISAELEPAQVVEESKVEAKSYAEESGVSSFKVANKNLTKEDILTVVKDKEPIEELKPVASTSQTIAENIQPKEDHRKVSPLKINLTHLDTSPKTPKITIKPIIKPEMFEEVKSVPKLTIKVTESQTICSRVVSKTLNSTEIQVVPKLTIKTVAKSDIEKSEPIVPKLTIKTKKEFDNECSILENAVLQTVPKLTIKTIVKPLDQPEKLKSKHMSSADSEDVLTVPKLTIKTSLIDSDSRSQSPTSKLMKPLVIDTNESSTISKLKIKGTGSYSPKLTIKPIPEPEVPKLTIKLPKYESDNSDDSESMITSTTIPKVTIKPIIKPDELVPKLTIKLQNDAFPETVHEPIPKLTIKPIIKPENENVIPKLTIRSIVNPNSINEMTVQEHHTPKLIIKPVVKPSNKLESNEMHTKANTETHPKITIKPIVKPLETVNESHPKIIIKPILKPNQYEATEPHPKITIKPIVKPNEIESNDMSEPLLKTTTKSITKSVQCEAADTHPKVTIKPITKQSEMNDIVASEGHPKITIKQIIKPTEIEATLKRIDKPSESDVVNDSHPKITIKPVINPNQTEDSHPKVTIKPIVKPSDADFIGISEDHPKITAKLIIKPNQIETLDSHPKVTIKPIIKPDEANEISDTHPKITIKQIIKPAEIESIPKIVGKTNESDIVVESKTVTKKLSENKTPEAAHPKITIKPIVKSNESESPETQSKLIIKSIVKQAEEEIPIPKLTIKPIFDTATIVSDGHSKLGTLSGNKKIVDKLELSIEGVPKQQPNAASKQDIINELDRSNISRKLENSSPKATVKRLNKAIEMEPLEINTNEKSTESGQESPRIILKINKTNQGSTSEIVSDLKIDKNVQNECVVEKIKLKMNKQGSRAEIIQDEKLIEEPSTSSGVKRHLEDPVVPEVKRIKTDEKKPFVQASGETEVLLIPKSIEKIRSETRLKEILSRIQQKIDEPNKHERILPSILQKPSTSSEIKDINSSESAETKHLLDSETKRKLPIMPISEEHESSSGDCIIIDESSQSNDPSDNEVCKTTVPLIDFNRECKIELINVPLPFQDFDKSPKKIPKKRGRPRKNPLPTPEATQIEHLPNSTNNEEVVIEISEEEKPKRRYRGRGTPKVPKGPRGRPRGSKRKLDTTPATSKAETDASPMDVDEPLSDRSFSQNMSESSATEASPFKELDGPMLPLVVTPRAPRGRGGRGRGRRGRGRGMRGRGNANRSPSKKSPTIWQTPEGNKESTLQVFEEDTRMSADLNSRGATPAKQVVSGEVGNEESQSSVLSSATTESTRAKRVRMEVGDGEVKDFSVDLIAEYTWPPVSDPSLRYLSDTYMIQEQIALFLGLRSFKRKYPDLKRRALDMEERDYIREKGLVTETLCDLGLTAVNSAEVLDIMCADFPQKYEEYRKFQRDKQAREFSSKQKALSLANNLDKNKKQSVKEQAIKSASDWNASFNKSRNESRRYCMDLQTFILNKPKRPVPPTPKVGNYPVALVPGQFCDYYKGYTPAELKYFPLDTVLYGPLKPNERITDNIEDYSDSDSDTSSSDSDSDTSSSDDTQATEDESISMPTLLNICKICHNTEVDELKLLRCSKCSEKIHTSCIDATDIMVNYIRAYPWQCSDCKSCCQCNLPSDDDKMLFCDQCDRGYHIYCVGIKKVPVGRWHCNNCSICNSCKTTHPDGSLSQNNIPINQWQHESTRNGHATLCMPCATLWRKKRYCTLCYRCHGDTDLLTACKVCNHQLHSDCVRRQYPGIDLAGVTCIDCAQKLVPITSSTIISQIQQNKSSLAGANTSSSSHIQKSSGVHTFSLQNAISTKTASTNLPSSSSIATSST